ncbi:hypothetical protein DPMN_166536 [Dreissena polymorpha]|uniref:Uncharacterized protein n=1 Tax=Dreissena polymorpha TaxID=45954 RepID=A0A9D4F1N6_DREPO|nr:hypothetical protein DPMN_166536 [Dreissena polymorpha]
MKIFKQPHRRYQENVDQCVEQEIDQCINQEKEEDASATMILDNNEEPPEVHKLEEIVDDVGCVMDIGYSYDVYDYNNNS